VVTPGAAIGFRILTDKPWALFARTRRQAIGYSFLHHSLPHGRFRCIPCWARQQAEDGPDRSSVSFGGDMTPAARISAAIEILDNILTGQPAEQALLRWSRGSRFAGSGDRAAVRDLVFHALRCRNSLAALGGGLSGRGLMIGLLREDGRDPSELFTGIGHAPAPIGDADQPKETVGNVVDLPDWVMPLWTPSLGDTAADVAAAMRQRAPVWMRVNPLRGSRDQAVAALAADDIEVTATAQAPHALRAVRNERRIAASKAYRDGLVELQDLSPQLACAALPVSGGMRVLDYCAGGGGKSLAIAAMAADLSLTAHDVDPARMADLPERAKRAGAVIKIAHRPQGPFDLVVADVPCSGSGTWRRTPDAKWRLTQAALDGVIQTQSRILANVADLVAPGGHLAYMTCSLLQAENGDQIKAFLARDSRFREIRRDSWTPLNASDGFFLALLRRDV
jgi:16S rRNA (cytosine967-C5)-methyltransferase